MEATRAKFNSRQVTSSSSLLSGEGKDFSLRKWRSDVKVGQTDELQVLNPSPNADRRPQSQNPSSPTRTASVLIPSPPQKTSPLSGHNGLSSSLGSTLSTEPTTQQWVSNRRPSRIFNSRAFLSDLISRLKNPETGLKMENDCFTGLDFVNWIASHTVCSKEDTIALGQKMVEGGELKIVNNNDNQTTFCDTIILTFDSPKKAEKEFASEKERLTIQFGVSDEIAESVLSVPKKEIREKLALRLKDAPKHLDKKFKEDKKEDKKLEKKRRNT